MLTIDVLEPPVVKATPFGDAVLTHRAWGFTIQAWADPPMKSYSVLGVLDQATGGFVQYPNTEEYASFPLAIFLELAMDPVVGPHVVATIDALKAAHQAIVNPQPVPEVPVEPQPSDVPGEPVPVEPPPEQPPEPAPVEPQQAGKSQNHDRHQNHARPTRGRRSRVKTSRR